jgi:hypothetical protein
MRAREFVRRNLKEETVLPPEQADPMRYTYIIPGLSAADPYKNYRFGVAMARARSDYADSTKCDDWGNEEYLAMCSIRDTISYNMIPQEFIKYIAGFPKAADAQWPTSSDFSDPEYDISDDEDDDFIEPSFCVNDALDNLGQTSKDIQMIRDKWADFSEEEELVRDLSALLVMFNMRFQQVAKNFGENLY